MDAVYRRLPAAPTAGSYGEALRDRPSAEVFHLDDEGLATGVWPTFDTGPWRKAMGVVS